ncbi:hypothetical protein BRC89_12395 [Halobacteriales archaeon QS_4_70_19]|nr:MAG: hypothetical protein BRC89_12395 [Halobacteriales archaeon QS_4_70_19]
MLVVTHGGPLFLLLAYVRGQDFQTAMNGAWPENTGLAELQVAHDDGTVAVVREPEPLHEPVPGHDETHPAGREGAADDEGADDGASDETGSGGPADDGAAHDGVEGRDTTTAVTERVAARRDGPRSGGGDDPDETESE